MKVDHAEVFPAHDRDHCAAGLARCAGQSEQHQHVQFFKAYVPRQVGQGYPGVQIITVSQNDETPPSRK